MYFSYVSVKMFLSKHVQCHLYEKWPSLEGHSSYFCISLGRSSSFYYNKIILTKNNQFIYIKVFWRVQRRYVNQYKTFVVKLIDIIVNNHLYFKLKQVCVGLKICNCQYFIFQAFPHETGELYVPNQVITFFWHWIWL